MNEKPKKNGHGNAPGQGRPTDELQAATSTMYFRCTPARKAAYVRAAKKRPLVDWVFEVCDRAADYTPKPNPENKP
jgi:hypothetical protein